MKIYLILTDNNQSENLYLFCFCVVVFLLLLFLFLNNSEINRSDLCNFYSKVICLEFLSKNIFFHFSLQYFNQ